MACGQQGTDAHRAKDCCLGAQLIREQMDAAVGAGLNMMRAWSHGVTANYALQTSPGVYNEAMFRGLDYALDQAAQHNIKVCTCCASQLI